MLLEVVILRSVENVGVPLQSHVKFESDGIDSMSVEIRRFHHLLHCEILVVEGEVPLEVLLTP